MFEATCIRMCSLFKNEKSTWSMEGVKLCRSLCQNYKICGKKRSDPNVQTIRSFLVHLLLLFLLLSDKKTPNLNCWDLNFTNSYLIVFSLDEMALIKFVYVSWVWGLVTQYWPCCIKYYVFNTKGRFFQDFLENLKCTLQNFKKILKKCFHVTDSIVYHRQIKRANEDNQLTSSVLAAMKN